MRTIKMLMISTMMLIAVPFKPILERAYWSVIATQAQKLDKVAKIYKNSKYAITKASKRVERFKEVGANTTVLKVLTRQYNILRGLVLDCSKGVWYINRETGRVLVLTNKENQLFIMGLKNRRVISSYAANKVNNGVLMTNKEIHQFLLNYGLSKRLDLIVQM